MANWLYAVNNQQLGPVTTEQLRSMLMANQMPWETLVWREGMPQWVPAGLVAELAPQAVAGLGGGPGAVGGAPVLAYATQSDVAHSLMIPDDPGPFAAIGKQLSIGSERWVGPCFATPRCFYLVKRSRMASQTGFAIGGLAGMIIAAAARSDEQTRTCDVAELPHGIRSAVDPKGKLGKCDVIVLPREALTQVSASGWGRSLKIQAGAEKFAITPGMFRFGQMKRDVAGLGWQFDVLMNPTINAPVARGLKPGTQRKPAWVRALYIVGGILLLIAFIVLRALAH